VYIFLNFVENIETEAIAKIIRIKPGERKDSLARKGRPI
jgi:hypothetical protein